jgi:hypothetical protein
MPKKNSCRFISFPRAMDGGAINALGGVLLLQNS